MIIGTRYNGPPGTGNGGYSAGRFAIESGVAGAGFPGADAGSAEQSPAVEVTLRRPPPLGVPLRVAGAGDHVEFWEGEHLVAQARPGTLATAELVAAVGWDEAVAVAEHSPALTGNPFPTCFVCGVERADGMRLFPGRLPGDRTATPWTAPADVEPELVWAALDCPGGWATAMDRQPYVLGRITARLLRRPDAGERCVIMGALTGEDGRKAFVTTTVYGGDGTPLAHAHAVWIALP
jgi:hypothetical protein